MTRVVSVGRSKGLVAAGALGLALAAVTLTGCPGSLDDPGAFPPPTTGGGGSTGAAGSSTGAAGSTTGAAGSTAIPTCITALMGVGTAANSGKYFCTTPGACHDSAGSAANLDLASANVATRLVGVTPKGGGAVPSICGADPASKTIPYITKGSATGAGLLLTKIMGPACSPMGLQMPTIGPKVSATDLTCFQQWATALANQ